jgi:hypothetical protein
MDQDDKGGLLRVLIKKAGFFIFWASALESDKKVEGILVWA